MMPTVVISARGDERLRSGHPWIYRADVADVRGRGRRHRRGAQRRAGRLLGQAFFSDRSQIALRMLSHGSATATGRRRADSAPARGGDRVSRRRWRSTRRVPPGPRRSRPAAVARRRSLRRLPRRADAVAGDGSAAAGWSCRCCQELLQPARHPGAERSAGARCSKGSSSASRCWPARCPRRVDGDARSASSTTSTCGTARRPGCSSISARTARRRRCTRAGGCSTASATTAASRCALARRCRGDDRVRRVGGRRRARRAERRAQRRRRSTRARATCSTSCAGSIGSASGSTRSCSIRRRSRRTRRRCRRRCAGYKEINLRALKLLNPGGYARHLQLLVQRDEGDVRRDRLRGVASTRSRRSPSSRSACRGAITRCCSACRRPTT